MRKSTDTEKFLIGDEIFWAYIRENSEKGNLTRSFDHPFLYSDEIEYKRRVHTNAVKELQLSKWKLWQGDTGHILNSVRMACTPQVSANLLEHRFGINGSYKALYRVETEKRIVALENALYDFFLGGDTSRDSFGPRFDTFAEYLRANKLGCNWAFIAYLSFLADHRRYFPILPTKFDAMLKFYNIPVKLAGHVTWEKYFALLSLADELKERLSIYGPTDIIGIQSYMWVVSTLVSSEQVDKVHIRKSMNFSDELNRRVKSAQENERIGLKGEFHVFQIEKDRLINAGRKDLGDKVQLVSEDRSLGYDILSFDTRGSEKHVEVKTTIRTQETDMGFWLSENERMTALKDSKWCLCRVWDIDVTPQVEFFGNIVQVRNENWEIKPATWQVVRK